MFGILEGVHSYGLSDGFSGKLFLPGILFVPSEARSE